MGESGVKAWEADKVKSDVYIPTIKSILGQVLIGEAPAEEDAHRNTDLIVMKLDSVRVACRIRNKSYMARYGDEFTIRCSRPSGTKTEMAKIIEGWGDYFFYGFGQDYGSGLAAWKIGDLRVFRLWLTKEIVRLKGDMPGFHKPNSDNSSNFRAFKWKDLPSDFVVAEGVDANAIFYTANCN
jgi:hypothetical protein